MKYCSTALPLDLPVVVERDDVRVLELREEARLLEEALQEVRLVLVVAVALDDLQRDGAIERLLRRVVDAPHSSASDGVEDLVLAVDGGAEERISPSAHHAALRVRRTPRDILGSVP
ncbi:MAG: hypothetical protein QM702_21235 [Rubrivivax sp.]